MKAPQFSPSVMCMALMNTGPQLEKLDKHVDQYHVDIMDGHFAPNIAMSPDWIKAAKPYVTKPLEVHLMTERPGMWLEPCAAAGASILSMHAETINRDGFRHINTVEGLGLRAGAVLNPATGLEIIEYFLERLSLVTLMTVDVGFAGQPFVEQVLPKIDRLAAMRDARGLDFTIQIDGSCNVKTFKRLRDAGAEMFILGSSGLFNLAKDVDAAWTAMLHDFEAATGEHVA